MFQKMSFYNQLKKGVEIHFKTKLFHGKEVLIFQI